MVAAPLASVKANLRHAEPWWSLPQHRLSEPARLQNSYTLPSLPHPLHPLMRANSRSSLVPGAGVEPAWTRGPGDFESPASASSATPAGAVPSSTGAGGCQRGWAAERASCNGAGSPRRGGARASHFQILARTRAVSAFFRAAVSCASFFSVSASLA